MKVYIMGETPESLAVRTFEVSGLVIKSHDDNDVVTEDCAVKFSTNSVQRAINFTAYNYQAVIVEVNDDETAVISDDEIFDDGGVFDDDRYDHLDYFNTNEEALNHLQTNGPAW